MKAIEVNNLTKVFRLPKREPGLRGAIKAIFYPRFEERLAVNAVSFSIAKGEIVGYIGVNGAGKSTTIKMLTGILTPSSGTVQVEGRDPHRQRVANARDIGVVFGQRSQLWWDLALQESLWMIARLYDVPRARFTQLLEEFATTLELEELLTKPIRTMSLGQKMRAELAATLIHEPKIVYLDEPTIGLDIIVKERIREFIKRMNRERGTTVVLTTHDLGDIEELCSRVLIIDAGRLIYDGPLQAIKERFGAQRAITFEMSAPVPKTFSPPTHTEIARIDGHTLELRFDRTATSASQIAAAVMSELEVLDFSLQEPDLENIIKRIYGGALSQEKTATQEKTAQNSGPNSSADGSTNKAGR